MQELIDLLKSQKLLVIASGAGEDIWISNVYYGVDGDLNLYFISPEGAKHSQHFLQNPEVAFSVAWFDPSNHKDRKAVQGRGVIKVAENDEDIAKGVALHNQNFPEFAERITASWIKVNEWNSKVWVLKPKYIKFWDDELYGEKETEEFWF